MFWKTFMAVETKFKTIISIFNIVTFDTTKNICLGGYLMARLDPALGVDMTLITGNCCMTHEFAFIGEFHGAIMTAITVLFMSSPVIREWSGVRRVLLVTLCTGDECVVFIRILCRIVMTCAAGDFL